MCRTDLWDKTICKLTFDSLMSYLSWYLDVWFLIDFRHLSNYSPLMLSLSRFIFCRTVLALYAPTIGKNGYVPRCVPSLPSVVDPTTATLQSAVMQIANIFGVSHSFVFSEYLVFPENKQWNVYSKLVSLYYRLLFFAVCFCVNGSGLPLAVIALHRMLSKALWMLLNFSQVGKK